MREFPFAQSEMCCCQPSRSAPIILLLLIAIHQMANTKKTSVMVIWNFWRGPFVWVCVRRGGQEKGLRWPETPTLQRVQLADDVDSGHTAGRLAETDFSASMTFWSSLARLLSLHDFKCFVILWPDGCNFLCSFFCYGLVCEHMSSVLRPWAKSD